MCIGILVLLASVVCGLPYTFARETIVTEPDRPNDLKGAHTVLSPRYFAPSGAQRTVLLIRSAFLRLMRMIIHKCDKVQLIQINATHFYPQS